MQTSGERIRVSPPSTRPGRRQLPLDQQHPTLLATEINDLPLIEHRHVLLALSAAIVSVYDEIQWRGPVERPHAADDEPPQRQRGS